MIFLVVIIHCCELVTPERCACSHSCNEAINILSRSKFLENEICKISLIFLKEFQVKASFTKGKHYSVRGHYLLVYSARGTKYIYTRTPSHPSADAV